MTTQSWLEVILTSLSIIALLAGVVKWYISIQVKPVLEAVEDIRKETKTNGGTSMRDEIKQIKIEQQDAKEKRKAQTEKIDHMYDLFIEYIATRKD
jgi:hypothetical protein